MHAVIGKIVAAPGDTVGRCVVEGNSRIVVALQDTSLADAPAVDIAVQEILTKRSRMFPISFEVAFNPKKILPRRTYTISVRVTDCGKGNNNNTGGDVRRWHNGGDGHHHHKCKPRADSANEPLTWISTTVNPAFQSADRTPLTIEVSRIRALQRR